MGKLRYLDMAREEGNNGEIILFDRFTEKTHLLNSTAAVIYNMCETSTVEEIANALVEGLTEKPDIEEVREDVRNTINEFIDNGVIIEI